MSTFWTTSLQIRTQKRPTRSSGTQRTVRIHGIKRDSRPRGSRDRTQFTLLGFGGPRGWQRASIGQRKANSALGEGDRRHEAPGSSAKGSRGVALPAGTVGHKRDSLSRMSLCPSNTFPMTPWQSSSASGVPHRRSFQRIRDASIVATAGILQRTARSRRSALAAEGLGIRKPIALVPTNQP